MCSNFGFLKFGLNEIDEMLKLATLKKKPVNQLGFL